MPMVVAKRNARERTRVHTVNQAFLVLKQHLPSLRQFTKRVSKLRILNAAINYIEALLKLIQSSDIIPQSAIAATLGPLVPSSGRQKKILSDRISIPPPPPPPLVSSLQPLPISSKREILLPAPIATCQPDHSLVDYRTPFTNPSSFSTVPTVQMSSVFTPQPTFPYMKSLLDYPSYLYPTQTTPMTPSTQSHIIVNNQIVSMPSYQCF